ncbi:MAG: hypothetical protein J6U82_01535 [Alistipes sp.]|nr:hypothetical protein [Alistipes sp.]
MKKILFLAAMLLGVVSCQRDQEGFDVAVGGEQEAVITLSLPEVTRSMSNTGFDFGDFANNTDYDLRFILEIHHGDKVVRDVQTSKNGTSATFSVRLVAGREYTFAAWADLVDENTNTDLYYNTANGLDEITLKEWTPMTEARDAYTCTVTEEFNPQTGVTMELKRPFAKVRVVSTDIQKVIDLGIEPTKAVVDYTSDLYTSYNAVLGAVAGTAAPKTHSFNYADVDSYTDNTGEKTMFTDYILIPAGDSETVIFSIDIQDATGTIKKTEFNSAIPVEVNKLTTLRGAVLTEGGKVSITVDGELGEKETINVVGTASDLQQVINAIEDGEEGNIQLGGDITISDLLNAGILSTRAATRDYIYIAEDKTVVLDLNGFKISQSDVENKYAFNNHGTFIIKDSKGGGSINARGIYNGYGDGAENVATAKIIVEGCSINAMGTNGGAAIFNYGVAEVKGGKFESNGGYGLNNQSGASMTITGGEIRGGIYNLGTLSIDGENTSVYQHLSGKHAIYNYAATATINNGAFDSESGNELILADGENSSVTINGGTFDKTAKSWLMGAATGKNITFVINGGTFRGYVNQPEMTVDTFRPYGDPIVVCGGNFNFNPTQWLSDDYTAKADNGLWTLERKADVAKIGEVGYTSLAKAVAAVNDGETITLVANEVFTKNNYYDNGGWKDGLGYAGDKSFTIDLGGNTISQDGYLNDYLLWFKNVGSKANTITIKNGTLDAGTTAYSALCTASSHENKLTVNIENINLVGNNTNGAVAKIRGGSELNVNAGTVITGKNNYVGIEAVGNNTVVNIYDNVNIYQNGTGSYVGAIVGASYNATMNIYGGYGKSAKCGIIVMSTGATINVSGGEWIANNDGTVTNDNNGVLVSQNNRYETGWACKSILNVTGGTFKGGYNCYGMGPGVEPDDAQINIKGGNFNADPASYVVAGYESVEENGAWTVGKPQALVEFEAAIAQGGNVTLTKDITLLESVVIEGKKVVLDLNGKTVNAPLFSAFEVKSGAELTIKNGKVVAYESTVRAIGGKATIESGEYTSTGTALDSPATYRYSLDCREGGELIIDGGTFKSNNGMINVGSTVTINGGKFENVVEKSMTRHFAYVSAPLTINDGEFYGKANASAGGCFFCGAAAGGDIQVNGGKFTSLWTSGSVNRIFEVYFGGTINVTGGMFNTNGGITTFVTENTDEATKAAYPYVAK